jgi:pimeloyl-ACP methyl ester carboxylesterase
MVYGSEDGAVEQRFFNQARPYFTGPYTALMLPGVGHFPQRERPEIFQKAVGEFLGKAPSHNP